ncbi:uncharacterized protein L201_001324 [Kwoniella dendrophila CBS 6074]|uniref:Peptidase A1 domain-containing protein n=1 Tax=Kwoniella dendrophila CBS 6074 TaxID=1295534 RepID=A0AAX4JM28_9TREE
MSSLSASVLAVLLTNNLYQVKADDKTDAARIGSEYTSMPLYRSGAGTNVLSVNVGNPPTELRLTCSTNVKFFVVASADCDKCVEHSNTLDTAFSQSLTMSQQDLAYVFPFPSGSSSTVSIGGTFATDVISDERGDEATPRPIVLATTIQTNDKNAILNGVDSRLTDGTAGFWGMGVYQDKKANSMIPSMITSDNDGSTEQLDSFTVGFRINNFSTNTNDLAGEIHWGAVPAGEYEGNFNWITTNTSVGGSWGFAVERFEHGGDVIDLEHHFGTIDPGFDSIYVPTNIAERVFSKVNGAQRDNVDTTRWNVPCDAHLDLRITISGTSYAIDPTSLVRNRDRAGRTCWSSIVAWQNGSVPEQNGEIRLGTPFMSGVYTALYYSGSAQYVGLAGKPNSVNAADLYHKDEGHPNMKLAGILIGTLVGLLVFGLLLCYARNRSSFQSIWYRSIRRQQRIQMNAAVRSATLPPPMMPIVGMGPPPFIPRGPPMSMMAPPMPMTGPPMPPPHMIGGMIPPPQPPHLQQSPPHSMQPQQQHFQEQSPPGLAPPPYQPPMIATQDPQQRQPLLHDHHQQRMDVMPLTVESHQQGQGYYSPRLQETSPSKSNYLPIPVPLPFNNKRSSKSKFRNSGYQYDQPSSIGGEGGSKVHFGPTSARHMRTSSSRSIGSENHNINEFGSFNEIGRCGQEGRYTRQNDFMKEYNNLKPSNHSEKHCEQPQPALSSNARAPKSVKYNNDIPDDLTEVPNEDEILPGQNQYPHQYQSPNQIQTQEKKRYFSWYNNNNNNASNKSDYTPVLPDDNGDNESQISYKSNTRKSWWNKNNDKNGNNWKEKESMLSGNNDTFSPRVKRGLGWS